MKIFLSPVTDKTVVTVFNKIDKLEGETILKDLSADYQVKLSAKTGQGIDALLETLETIMRNDRILNVHLRVGAVRHMEDDVAVFGFLQGVAVGPELEKEGIRRHPLLEIDQVLETPASVTLTKGKEPQVLIYHTHTTESYGVIQRL